MKTQILLRRYTQGLVNSVKDEAEFLITQGELSDFLQLLSQHKKLKKVLFSPFISKTHKTEIAEEVLEKRPYGKKVSRFILLLIDKGRIELLPDIIESFPLLWNEHRGVSTFEVASVVLLTDIQKIKLEEKLELLEKRPVIVKYRINPELIGGLRIRRGSIIYDVSIKGSLMDLKEKISEGQAKKWK